MGSSFERYLLDGETLGKPIVSGELGSSFYIWPINSSEHESGDRVILDIPSATEPNILIGGNPLNIEVLDGFGRLRAIELASRKEENKFLEPGVELEIPSDNIIYYYENLGESSLVIRDTCPSFRLEHEPLVKNVAEALINLF